jgi:hypothetical protein
MVALLSEVYPSLLDAKKQSDAEKEKKNKAKGKEGDSTAATDTSDEREGPEGRGG